MLASLRTATLLGLDAVPVDVEVDVSFGLPSFTVVGLPDTSLRESRERVRSAVRNSGFEFPLRRITVNLSPADVRKAGTAFDLPVALGILAASGIVGRREIGDTLVLGELSLDGGIRSTRGVLPVAASARRLGCRHLLVPPGNADEAAIVQGLDVLPVATLAEAVGVLNDPAAAVRQTRRVAATPPMGAQPDLADVRGQLAARRALEIAAAGHHNLLLTGAPGGGKTLLARRLPGILGPLEFDEALEVTSIHSIAGVLPEGGTLLWQPPFRAPHHTASDVALVGGGQQARPGEISLAHRGVLFLDELPEFDRHVLEALRQPLEQGHVVVSRASRTVAWPARFLLVAAMNPCPCGFHGHATRTCRCRPTQVDRYAGRISGPLRDRIDLVVAVPPVPPADLGRLPPGEASGVVRSRVCAARASQRRRNPGGVANGALEGRALEVACAPTGAARRLLSAAAERLGLTARGYERALRVARSVADLAGEDQVTDAHVAETLQLRGAES